MHDDLRRRTPRADAVLAEAPVAAAITKHGRARVKSQVDAALEACRIGEIDPEDVVERVIRRLGRGVTSSHPVLNATGVVVHTNLGRAPLSAAAREAVLAASGTTDVELDLRTGRRGPRGGAALRALAAAVPAAEAVHVVNNGAAALALAACALAADREVVVARGELVEIGDGFRIPELLESVGARLREVGTTNRVRLADYANVIDERTAFVLKVHPSNFRVEGFTSTVGIEELTTLGVPVVADLGSGLLSHHPRLPDEPDASSWLRAGAALVTASGDKLLGGPQCGLLLGSSALIEQLRRHPLARALRVDKLTLAALEATLTGPLPPVAASLATTPETLMRRAQALATAIGSPAAAVGSVAVVGGGGAPGVELRSAAIALPERLAEPLRRAEVAVLGHLTDGRLLLDLVGIAPEDDSTLRDIVRRVLGDGG